MSYLEQQQMQVLVGYGSSPWIDIPQQQQLGLSSGMALGMQQINQRVDRPGYCAKHDNHFPARGGVTCGHCAREKREKEAGIPERYSCETHRVNFPAGSKCKFCISEKGTFKQKQLSAAPLIFNPKDLIKPKEEKTGMFDFVKQYLKRHEDAVGTVFFVLIIDWFFFGGALRHRIKGIAEDMLNSAQKKLSHLPEDKDGQAKA